MRSLLFVVLLLASTAAVGQTDSAGVRRDTVYQLSPVIVNPIHATARQTPATFSDLDRAALARRSADRDVPVLLSELPSMMFYSENGNGIGYSYVSLRGFDQRRLSVMVNGVPQNDPEDHNVYWIDFPDLLASTDAVQVQRGAGSAFYGPPAIGGSIDLVTNPFSRERGITLESSFGFQERGGTRSSTTLNTRRRSIAVNSGLVDGTWMFYGRLGRLTSTGYRDNAWVEMDSYFLGAMRFYDAMSFRVHVFGGPIRDGLAYYGLPKFAGGDPDLRRANLAWWVADSTGTAYAASAPRRPQEAESFSQPHAELIHEWRLSPGVTLKQTLFAYAGEGFYDYDASWADTTLLRLGSAYGYPASANPTNALVRASVDNHQWGYLPRIEFDGEGNDLTLGLELRFHRSTHYGTIPFAEGLPAGFDPDYRFYEYDGARDIVSGYVHNVHRLTSDLTLMTDVQAVHNRYAIGREKYLGNDFALDYFFVNPRAGLNLNVDDRTHAYVSAAYTSREPRMRNLYAAEDSYFGATPQFAADTAGGSVRYDFSRPLAKPERLLDLELGAGYAADGVRVSANVFWMEFYDELVKSGQVDIFGQPVTGNAERTRHAGVELDANVRISGPFTASGNVSLSRNRLVRYTAFDDAGVPMNLDGNPIAGFPDVLANLRLTYDDGSASASLLVKHVGAFATDNTDSPARRNDAYTVVDASGSLGWAAPGGETLTLRAEVRNLFNKLYFASGEGDAYFPAAERNYVLGLAIRL